MRKLLVVLASSAGLLLAGTASASAAVLPVDDDGRAKPSNCNANSPASPTIQGAVDAASAGDTITVCPGTYPEQVTIDDTKDDLRLVSVQRRAAIIQAPPTFDRTRPDIVRVEGAEDVELLRFTIRGPIPDTAFCNDELVSGVRIIDDGSATLVDNRITEIRSASLALRGCQNGFGVGIGGEFADETGTGRLFDNEIDRYQKGGIYVDNAGSLLDARRQRRAGRG